MNPRTFSPVTIALHGRPQDIEAMYHRFEHNHRNLAIVETERPRIVLGQARHFNAYAPNLVEQLHASGYRFYEARLERYPAYFSKKEVAQVERRGYGYAREGHPKIDHAGARVRSEAFLLEFRYEPRILPMDHSDHVISRPAVLNLLLKDWVWRRARTGTWYIPGEPGTELILAEFSLPTGTRPKTLTELHFGAKTLFWSEPYRPG